MGKKTFGYYGVISPSDAFLKKLEYQAWLVEVRNKDLTPENEKKYLPEFIEKFNKAELPSKKYHNIHRWMAKEKEKEMRKHMKEKEKLRYINRDVGEDFVFDDEGRKEKEKKLLRELDEKRRLDDALYNMNREKAEAMKEIDFKGNLMRHYYQTGDMEAAKDIHKQYFGKRKDGKEQANPDKGEYDQDGDDDL
jgi:hypothetical protein